MTTNLNAVIALYKKNCLAKRLCFPTYNFAKKIAYCSACVKKALKTFTAALNPEKSFGWKIRKPKAVKIVLAAGCYSQDQLYFRAVLYLWCYWKLFSLVITVWVIMLDLWCISLGLFKPGHDSRLNISLSICSLHFFGLVPWLTDFTQWEMCLKSVPLYKSKCPLSKDCSRACELTEMVI